MGMMVGFPVWRITVQPCACALQLFIGFGFPYEGPAPLEAIANGCVFLQARFHPPHSSLNHEFFRGKPTSREASVLPAAPTLHQALGSSKAGVPCFWQDFLCGCLQVGSPFGI